MSRYVPYSWYEYPSNRPMESGDYYCVCLIPKIGGYYERCQRVLRYESTYSSKWLCEGMIVTHWMLPIAMP